jgi:hypothetical protein
MKHYYENVPQLGNVALSRHTQDRLAADGVTDETVADVLANGDTIPDGQDVVWREKDGVRLVIVKRPTPFRGAALATTGFRVKEQLRSRR